MVTACGLVGLAMALAACSDGSGEAAATGAGSAKQGGLPGVRSGLPVIWFTNAQTRSAALAVEVADDGQEQTCGLMWRTEMPENQGMLFAFNHDYFGGFWNRNTLIPLSVAYVAGDGTIVDIVDMQAIHEGEEPTIQQPRQVPGRPVRFVIEVNQGWFARHEIAIGDRVNVSAAMAAAAAAAPPPVSPC
jgi:uncharacterized membrane protein (UPF0127 family)